MTIGMSNAAVYDSDIPSSQSSGDGSVTQPREGRSTDVSRVSLTVPMALSLAFAVAIVVGAFWQIRASDNGQLMEIKAAVSAMKTNLEAEARVNAADKRADSVVIDNLSKSVDDLKRQTQLLQMQYAEMQKTRR